MLRYGGENKIAFVGIIGSAVLFVKKSQVFSKRVQHIKFIVIKRV